ncbi:haloacid dehalogenase type II [Paraburkholderia hospita]|jgi:2-haloacid dehalogenase|uniref:haloacid dehalogenase type II n=1 Tax=Paraburkholderia hospita TaxID=169430 RepID=UPI000271BF9A|nr:haloacid dehalogenase type II [Paraburkholderia hospita]EUC16832.1 haloacid dehalogenase, type II [Burkholderia sp. BT03]SKD03741.1 2-haloalkanoic acid dehalogenase, type II [Paraburkholderia hospita]
MNHIKAIAFDLYGTLFDVHSVAVQCDEQFPGRGQEISNVWRQKQLEYTWLRSLMNRYIPFEHVTEEALRFTIRHLGLELDERACRSLSDAYLRLQAYPEVPDALRALRDRGLKLAILSNGSPHSIDAVVTNAGLRNSFDHLLSVDPVRVYKPDNRAYELAEQTFGVGRREILFVSSNAWDATGARYFGFPTCWINRGGKTFEEMGQRPDWEVNGLDRLVTLFASANG